MANPDHLEKLCQGPKVWNEWRRENPHIVPDLSQATLGLNQRQFGPSSGGPIDLRAANLDGAMLRFATLTEADLEGARLIGADLMHARLDHAKLIAADLTDAMLDHADLTGADLSRTIITGASFINARNLTQLQIDDAFGDASTLLPASLVPPQCWFPVYDDDEDAYANYDPDEEEDENLYEFLGLERNATQEEIRTSYRALVKKLHPDLNPDDKPAQEMFKKVSTAYRILGDPEKRAAYDSGEIDSEGRVRPEFEAEQQFRKYAFRFYAAAVMSVILAVGALIFAWNAVLRSGDNRATVAVTTSKQYERLGNDAAPRRNARLEIDEGKAEAIAERAGFGKQEAPNAGGSELEKGVVLTGPKAMDATSKPENTENMEKAEKPEMNAGEGKAEFRSPAGAPTPPPGEDKAVKSASLEPSASSGVEANPQQPQDQQLSPKMEGSASPLAEDHKDDEAGATQSPSASSDTPEGQAPAHRTQPDNTALSNARSDGDEAGEDPAAAIVPEAGNDAVSSVLRRRAINQAMAKQEPQTTASVDNGTEIRPPVAPRAHTQSLSGGMRIHRRRVMHNRRPMKRFARSFSDAAINEADTGEMRSPSYIFREPPPRDRRYDRERRREAVSDILSGGL